MELDEIISEVKKHITEKRYVHTEGVAFTAAALAMKFSYESGYREMITWNLWIRQGQRGIFMTTQSVFPMKNC